MRTLPGSRTFQEQALLVFSFKNNTPIEIEKKSEYILISKFVFR